MGEPTSIPDQYIELHLHLDGAVTVDIAKKLARLQGIELPASRDEELLALLSVSPDCESLNDFLKCFELPLSLLQTREAISEAVYLVLENVKSQGVIYAEIRFAPQFHTRKGLTQEGAVKAAVEGLERSEIPANLILCCMRGNGTWEANNETVELASRYLVEHGGVTGLDLAGAEALYPTRDYEELFARARACGIPFTIHAGEADGPSSVESAVRMGARRIGHGVRIGSDYRLLDLIEERGICLEMCPTSNRQTRAVTDMSKYPLNEYLMRGIKVTLSTDDMAICRTTLRDEYKYVQETCGISACQQRTLLDNAADAAFTDRATRAKLKACINKVKH